MEQCNGNAWWDSSMISLREQTMGSTWVKCERVRGQGSFDAWVDRDDSLRAVWREDEETEENREMVKCWERGRRAIFTVRPSKSPCVNCNMYVGWCNLRPSRHTNPGFAWSWRLTQRCEASGRDGEEGTLCLGCHGLNKETLWAQSFRYFLSNQQLQTIFFSVFYLNCCENADDEN